MDAANVTTSHHAVATAPAMASTAAPPPPPAAPTLSSTEPTITTAAPHPNHHNNNNADHPNLFTHAPSLASSFSSVTTASASSLTTSNTSRSSNGTSGEDRRLHNMPKPLASKCVEAFIAWGHDHKGNPAAYQQFLRLNLPDYPGVDAEKVRLYMKNICATYHERYLPARARGYNQDFLAWWDKRPGRGRPKKDMTVSSAYALAHHLDPSLATSRGRGSSNNTENGRAGGLASTKPRRRRTPTKRAKAAKAAKATAAAARGGVQAKMRRPSGGGGGGGGRGNYSDEDEDDDNEVYYYGSDFGEIDGEEDDDTDDEMDEDHYHRHQQLKAKKKGAVRGFSKSGRAIRRPSDPYLNAVQEEATKRARIEAALAMMEMDDNNGRATGRGPPPPGIRTPSPPLFSTYRGASIYPVLHQGRNALRIESPVPLTDQDVTAILTDLRSNSIVNDNEGNGGSGGGCGGASNNTTIANEDSKMPAPTAAAGMATPSASSPRSRTPVAIRIGGNPAATHAVPPPCAQALAGLVKLGGARNLGRATSPSSRLVEVNPPAHARPHHHHYVLHPHPHPHAAAGPIYMTSAPAAATAAAAAAAPSASPVQFLLGSNGPPPQHPGQRHHAHAQAHSHAHTHAHGLAHTNMHGSVPAPLYHQYIHHPQARVCHNLHCTGCPAPTFLSPPPPPAASNHHYRGGNEGAAHRRG